MAGITKRKDTWYAGFRINGKLKILTTGIKICPSIPAGKTKSAVMKEAELQARIIAEELEKEAKGAILNVNVFVSLAGNKAKSVLRNKKYMPASRNTSANGCHHAPTCVPRPATQKRSEPSLNSSVPIKIYPWIQ